MSQSEPKNNARKCDQEPPTFCDDSSIFGWLPSPPPSHNGDLLGEYEQIEEDPSVTSKSPQPSSMESLRGLSFEKMATKGSDCNDSPRVSSECLLVRYEWLQTGLGHHQAAKVTHRGTLPYQHSQRHRSTTRTPSTPRQNSLKSNKGDCKRRRDGDDSGDDGDGGNKRRVQPVQLLETSALPLRWACPFQKFDPEGESRCSLEFCGFVEIWDVK
jgi:hypothetical protein